MEDKYRACPLGEPFSTKQLGEEQDSVKTDDIFSTGTLKEIIDHRWTTKPCTHSNDQLLLFDIIY